MAAGAVDTVRADLVWTATMDTFLSSFSTKGMVPQQNTTEQNRTNRTGATVVQEVEKSFSKQKVVSSIPCRSVLEQDTEPLIAPDVQCAISVNVYTSL